MDWTPDAISNSNAQLRLTIYPSLAAGSMMSVLHIWDLLMPMLGMTRTFARSLANSPEEVAASSWRGELKLQTSTILLRLLRSESLSR